MSRKKKVGLGLGLSALLGGDDADPIQAAANPQASGGDDTVRTLPLNLLQAGKYQPRTRMDEEELQELADSIVEHGVIQPILVRPIDSERYEIIAGERRFRAAALAQLREVPVIVREVNDEQALAIALIENIQRENLNPLEEAQAIRRLLDEFDYTHERAAQAIGRSRSATSNLLRLLNLAEPVQTMLLAGDIEMGHARCLLALDRAEQILIGHQIIQRRLSVREAEKLVSSHLKTHAGNGTNDGRPPSAGRAQGQWDDRDVERLRDRIADHLGARVDIVSGARGKGRLVIHFSDSIAFNGLLDRMNLNQLLEEQDA